MKLWTWCLVVTVLGVLCETVLGAHAADQTPLREGDWTLSLREEPCAAGYEPTEDGTGCNECRVGTYKPEISNEDCTSCASGYTTSDTASTSSTDCTATESTTEADNSAVYLGIVGVGVVAICGLLAFRGSEKPTPPTHHDQEMGPHERPIVMTEPEFRAVAAHGGELPPSVAETDAEDLQAEAPEQFAVAAHGARPPSYTSATRPQVDANAPGGPGDDSPPSLDDYARSPTGADW